jgi:hypothetical protein
LDNADFASAYRHLLGGHVDGPLWLRALAEVGLFLGGAVFAYALTILVNGAAGPGAALALSGVLIGILCAIMKHIRIARD